jgi:hypothetical protein
MTSLMHRVPLIAACVGVSVPLICYSAAYVFDLSFATWTLIIWPSSLMLLAIVHPGPSAIVLQGISVLINGIIYAAVGSLLELILKGIRWALRQTS